MIAAETEFTVIFNTVNDAWGSYGYDESKDVFRITVIPQKAHHEEWLAFEFEDLAGTSAEAFLHWAELKIPFKIETAK